MSHCFGWKPKGFRTTLDARMVDNRVKRCLGCVLTVMTIALVAVPAAIAARPSVSVQPATEVGQTTATVHGMVNPEGTDTKYVFEYSGTGIGEAPCENGGSGLTDEKDAGSGNRPVNVAERLTELTPGTKYCVTVIAYRCETPSEGECGPEEREEEVDSSVVTFSTSGTASSPPEVETESATNVTATEATLRGSINPSWKSSEYYFEYGTEAGHYTSATPRQAAGSEGETLAASARITGLKSATTYHFRIVGQSVGGIAYGADKTFTTTPEWPHVFFVDSSAGDTLADWTYNPKLGWHINHFMRDYVAPKTSPSTTLWNNQPNVFFSDGNDKSKEDSKGEISDWSWTPAGWNLTPFYQDEVAADSSPSAIIANGAPDVFFADGAPSPTISYWMWSLERGWHIERLGKDYVSAGSSPDATVWKGETPQVFFPDGNDNSEMSLWQWNGGAGWQFSSFFVDYVLPGTSPSALMWGSTPNVFFIDGLQSNTLADWVWASTGWHLERFYQDSVAPGTSPSAIMVGGLPHVFFVDASHEDRLADWTWNSEQGWHIVHLESSGSKDYAAAGTSPAAMMWGSTVHVFFVDGLDNNEMSDWVGTGAPSQWHVENFFQDAVASGTSPSPIMWSTLIPEPPVNTRAPAVTGVDTEGQKLTTTDGTWSEATSYTYAWQRCGSGKCSNISGATGRVYEIQSADVGSTLQAVVTASGPGGFTSATSETTYVDSSGHKHEAVGFGNVTNAQPGPISGSLGVLFNGSGSGSGAHSSSIRSSATPISSTTNWTLEAWINPSTLSQNGMAVFDGDHAGEGKEDSGFGFAVAGAQGGEIWGGCLTGLYEGIAWIDTGYCFPAAHRWYYVVETNTNGTVRFYVNGTGVYTGNPGTPGAPSGIIIGGYDGAPFGGFGGRWFQGMISNVAFYAVPLSESQVTAHYSAASSQTAYSGAVLASTPTAYYQLGDGAPVSP